MLGERKKRRQAKAEGRFLEEVQRLFERGAHELILGRGGYVTRSTGTPAQIEKQIRQTAWQQWGDDIIKMFASLTYWELKHLKDWDDITLPPLVLHQSRASAATWLGVPAPEFSQRVDEFLLTAQPKFDMEDGLLRMRRMQWSVGRQLRGVSSTRERRQVHEAVWGRGPTL